jgi:hypothetical protein
VDEMKLIEEFCAEPAAPEPDRLARSRARLISAIEGSRRSSPQRHQRRRVIIAAMAGIVTVAAAAVLAATLSTGSTSSPGGELPAQTTAYIVGHTERALAAAERGSLIERLTGPTIAFFPRTDGLAGAVLPAPHPFIRFSSLKVTHTRSWFYRGQTRIAGFTVDGRLAIDAGPAAARTGGTQPSRSIVAVNPDGRTWYHPLQMPGRSRSGHFTCSNQGMEWLAVGREGQPPAEVTALISKALSCHLFRAAGHQQVDGVDTLRLAAAPRLLRELHAPGLVGPDVTLLVNTKTFLPVRLTLGPQAWASFGWLKPTAANLSTLRVKVPAGLREVRLPAGASFGWEVVPAWRTP